LSTITVVLGAVVGAVVVGRVVTRGIVPHLGSGPVTTSTWGPHWLAAAERPARLRDVPFADLPADLRLLLVSEGPLAYALEAYQLGPIVADAEGHEQMLLDADHARWLRARPNDLALSRRTALREQATGRLIVHADSVLLLDRLPPAFLEVLATEPTGLGGAFARLELETRRELLWFGRTPLRGLRPGDRALAGDSGVSRSYRLIVEGTPVCFIEETFPDTVVQGRLTPERSASRGGR
jgi:chorismate-pyruvate lyase